MALTGRSRVTSASSAARRMRQEEELIRRRNAEQDRAALWNGVETYFKQWDVKTSKANEWCSDEYYKTNEQQRAEAQVKSEKEARLAERRERLRALLAEESELLVQELRAHEAQDAGQITELKALTEDVKRREEEARLKESQRRLEQHWKENEPVLSDHRRQLHSGFVRRAWVDQVRERHKALDEEEQREKEEAEKRQKEVLEEEQREKEEQEERRRRAVELQQQLLEQIDELRQKENQAEDLKAEVAKAVEEQAELDAIYLERSLAEKKRKNLELGCFLTHQYQLKLRRRAREIQEELATDLRLLERLMAEEAVELYRRSEQREKAIAEMEDMRAAFKEQKEREEEREKNLQFIFHEEARRMWNKQEAQWNADRAAREHLMNQVLVFRQQQLETKLADNLEKQRRLLAERENLLAAVEQANEELKREKQALGRSKEERRKEVDRQVAEKQERERERLRAEAREMERNVEKEKAAEEKVMKELANMDVAGYQPQDQGRRRIIW